MDKRLNKQELKKRIAERRIKLAREKRLQEAKNRRLREARTRTRRLQETSRTAARVNPTRTIPKRINPVRPTPRVVPSLAEKRGLANRQASRTVSPVALRERTRVPQRRVIKESLLTQRGKRQETLTENIRRRNRENRIPAGQEKAYTILAENIANYAQAAVSLKENFNSASQRTDVGIGGVQTFFDIFYGAFPQLIAPEIASVQPLKTENGFIFYMQYVAGSDKGSIEKGTVLADPFQVASQDEYTSNTVTIPKNEEVTLWAPYKSKSIKIEGVELEWTSETEFKDKAVGTDITGEVTVTDNTIKVTIAGNNAGDVTHVTYDYDNAYVPTETPLLAPNVVRLPISAKFRTLKTNHAFSAAYGYEAEHGDDIGGILAKAATDQIKREIDLEVLFAVFNAAPSKVTWNKAAGVAVGGYQEHKLSFQDAIIGASNLIFKKSKRVRGNVLVVGIDALTVVETLPAFTGLEMGDQLPGASVVGKLKKMPVVVSPDIPAADWAVIYKNPVENFDAGIVFAPYLPVFATEPAILDDFMVRQAFITAYAIKVVNPNYFVAGTIINTPTALPIFLTNKDGSVGEDALDFGVIEDDATLDIFGEE